MTDPREIDAFLTDLMPRLGAMARTGFADPGAVRFKSRGQPVTRTDGAIEQEARRAITGAWPDHAVVGEEMGGEPGEADTIWYVDPIDGTLNFTRGLPFFAVSIGVRQGNRMVVGHVLDPLREEHFHAVAGSGSWLGNERLTLSGIRRIEDADLSMQTSARGLYLRKPGFLAELHRRFQKTRKFGSIALELAYVAAGRLDLLIAGKGKPQAWWDLAGGWALIEEAGGIVVDLERRPLTQQSTHLAAGHPELVDAFLELFHSWPEPARPQGNSSERFGPD